MRAAYPRTPTSAYQNLKSITGETSGLSAPLFAPPAGKDPRVMTCGQIFILGLDAFVIMQNLSTQNINVSDSAI
jgi:hypothetical protein